MSEQHDNDPPKPAAPPVETLAEAKPNGASKNGNGKANGVKLNGAASRELPIVRLSVDTARVVKATEATLAHAANTYERGGLLVRVVENPNDKRVKRDAGAPTIRPHTLATLECEVSTVARFERTRRSKSGEETIESCSPPPKVLAALLDAGAWPNVRPLQGVASSPILRPDGTIAQVPGYDAASGYLLSFDPRKAIVIGNMPSKAEALGARDVLLELVADFPFQTDADRSAWLALVLTLLARAAIDGPCPLWLVTANIRGAGKSRLIDVASMIVTGRKASRATQPADDAEMGKLITSILMAGDDLALLDNIDRPLGGAKLDALLTGGRWRDRVLGGNLLVDLAILTVFAATGNNLELKGDTHRRGLPIRIESLEEKPEERQDFTIKNLLEHVRQDRPRFVACALTILRAWFAAGRPETDARPWGSFEEWSAVVPHVLRWIDMADPQDTRAELEADDPHLRALGVVLATWPALEEQCRATTGRGLAIAEALAALYREQPKPRAQQELAPSAPTSGPAGVAAKLDELRAALEALAPGRGGNPVDGRTLAHAFRRSARRVLGGRRLVQAGTGKGGLVRWTVAAGSEATP